MVHVMLVAFAFIYEYWCPTRFQFCDLMLM